MMDIYYELRKVPFIRLLIPFTTGILLQLFTKYIISEVTGVIVIVTGLAYIFINRFTGYFKIYKVRWLSGTLIYIFMLLAGFTVASIRDHPDLGMKISLNDSNEFTGIILEEPELKNNSVSTIVKLQGYYKNKVFFPLNYKLLAYFPKDSLAGIPEYGDRILFRARLSEINPPGNPFAFDYKRYMANSEIFYQVFLKPGDFVKISSHKGNMLKETALRLRRNLLNVYIKNGIKGKEYAVLSALTLGYREELDTATKKSFASSGTIHVLAVSGLHVGIIFLVLNFLFRPLERKTTGRILKVLTILILLWFYALITGLSASVVRASSMFSLLLVGSSLRRPVNIYNIIAVSAFILLLINPYELTNVGFQLSYLAVISIVFIQPALYRSVVVKSWFVDKIWALFTLSVAAQIGTFPLTIYYFNQFPVYFWLSNLLMIPMITLILYLAFLLFMVSFIPFIPAVLSKILLFLLRGANNWASFIEDLPGSVIHNINSNISDIILCYSLIIVFSIFIVTRQKKWIFYLLSVILLLTGNNLYKQFLLQKQCRLVVYHISHGTAIDFIKGKKHVFFTDHIDSMNNQRLDYAVKNNWIKSGLFHRSSLINPYSIPVKANDTNFGDMDLFETKIKGNPYYCFNGYNLLIVINDSLNYCRSSRRLKLDYMIITQDIRLNKQNLQTLFKVDKIVLDGSNTFVAKQHYITKSADILKNVYLTGSEGAVDIDIHSMNNKLSNNTVDFN